MRISGSDLRVPAYETAKRLHYNYSTPGRTFFLYLPTFMCGNYMVYCIIKYRIKDDEMAVKYYAVAVGKKTGIYTKWDECKAMVHGFPGRFTRVLRRRKKRRRF